MSEELAMKMAASEAEHPDELKCIALGEEDTAEEIAQVLSEPTDISVEARLASIESRILFMTNSLDSLFAMVKGLREESSRDQDVKINETIEKKKKEQKVEIPEGTTLHCKTKGLSYFCQVKPDGFYVGETQYDSLSAAAEGISGVRRSGWTFWKLPNGKTVKEVYKDKQA